MSNYNKKVVDFVEFSNTAPNYVYDDKTEKLSIQGTRDLQQEINEGLDCALEKVVQRFGMLPPTENFSLIEGVGNVKTYLDKKDQFSDAFDYLNDIRDRYNLPLDISDKALNDFITEQIGFLKGKIESTLKGGVKSETQKVEQEKE